MNRENGRKVKFLFGFLFVLCFVFVVMQYFAIKFDFSDMMNINVGSNRYDIIATFFNRDISSVVNVNSDIDVNRVGTYNVEVSYTTFMHLTKRESVEVNVVDNESPVITLIGDERTVIKLNSVYKDLGYNVTDNYDKAVNVEVLGDVDASKVGTYYVDYIATDSSNNKSSVRREVIVEG